MKHEAMLEMSKTELDCYGNIIGVDVSGKKTVAQKVAAIEKRRERTADLDVLGLTITIPIKRMHDKRVSDLLSDKNITDAAAEKLMVTILGDEQMEKLTERLTDEDGTVDVDAMGYALARVLNADELKNY